MLCGRYVQAMHSAVTAWDATVAAYAHTSEPNNGMLCGNAQF